LPSVPDSADVHRDAALAITRTFDPEPPAGLPYDFNLEAPQVGYEAVAILAYLARQRPETRITVGELAGFFGADPGGVSAAVSEIIRAGWAVPV
jgi:hypothetical protein